MSSLLAVTWNVNTYTSASKPLSETDDKALDRFNTNAGFQDYVNKFATLNSMSVDDVLYSISDKWNSQYNARSAFTSLDPAARVQLLCTAVKKAADWAWTNAAGPQLIFAAPEYLFAESGYKHLLNGQHWHDTIVTALAQLSKKHKEVLLFPGTISYLEDIGANSVRARASLYDDMNFWSKHGKPFGGSVERENRQKIQSIAMRNGAFDVGNNKLYVYLGGKRLLEYRKRGDFSEITKDEARQNLVYVPGKQEGTLNAFGKRFGVEVCLDHDMGYSKRESGKRYDVHVIVSASVEPVPANEKCVDPGWVKSKAGYVVHASCNPKYTQVVRRSAAGREVLTEIWKETLGAHGTLYGYLLDFDPVDSKTGMIAPSTVSNLKNFWKTAFAK